MTCLISGVVVVVDMLMSNLLVFDRRLDGQLLDHGSLVGLDLWQRDESASLHELLLGSRVQCARHRL